MESPSRDTKTLKRSSSSREIMDGMVRLKDSPELQYRLLLVFGLFLLWLSRSTVHTQSGHTSAPPDRLAGPHGHGQRAPVEGGRLAAPLEARV